MASSEFWQRVSASVTSPEWVGGATGNSTRSTTTSSSTHWMWLDAFTVLGAAVVATLWEIHAYPLDGVKEFFRGTLIRGSSVGVLLALLCGFTLSLIITSRRLNLYHPTRLTGFLNEQRLTVQACFTSGLLLTGTIYLIHACLLYT